MSGIFTKSNGLVFLAGILVGLVDNHGPDAWQFYVLIVAVLLAAIGGRVSADE